MKRDMDLIRQLLLLAEENATQKGFFEPEFDDYSTEEINYHIELLEQAGLAKTFRIATGMGDYWKLGALTWDGQDFLANAKNQTAWNQAKELVKSKGGTASFEIFKAILVSAVKSQFPGAG